jgi:hypothetical protein
MDWIDLAQDMDRWMVLVNTLLSLRVLERLRNWRLLKKGSAQWS